MKKPQGRIINSQLEQAFLAKSRDQDNWRSEWVVMHSPYDGSSRGVCPCGKKGICQMTIFENTVNHKILKVGSECRKKYPLNRMRSG